MILLALDQSSHITGFAVFEDQKLIHKGKFNLDSEDLGERLYDYRQTLIELIKKHKIDLVAFEDIQMQNQINNVSTYKILAEIFGITQELMVELKIPYQVVSSNTWKSKLEIKGKQRAEQKRNAQAWVLNTYGLKCTQDEADSICLGASTFVKDKTETRHYSFE